MSKKTFFVLVLLVIILLCIRITVHIYKENIPQLLDMFIALDKKDEKKKKNLIKERIKIEYRHLSVYYLESDEGLIKVTKDALDRAITLNESLFNFNYNKSYDIIIFKNNAEIEEFCNLEFAIGCHSERTKSLAILPEDKEAISEGIESYAVAYKKNVMHEYTHYVFTQKNSEFGLTDKDIPLWFSEGVAEYIGYDDAEISETDSTILPFNQLTTYKQWNNYRIDIQYDVYLQSYLAIRFLVNEYGNNIINQIISETKTNGGFEKGFQNATGLRVNELSNYIY